MTSPELHERLAVVESRVDDIRDTLKIHVEREDADRDKIMASLSMIRQDMSKQKGFWAGIVFAASALVTVVSVAIAKWGH